MTVLKRRALVVRRLTDEHQFEAFVTILCLMAAVPLLVSGPPLGVLPPVLVVLWGVELALGGGTVLVALAAGSVRWERYGLTLLAASSVAWSIVNVYKLGWPGVGEALPTVLFAATCMFRYRATRCTAILHLGRRGVDAL